jgi:hypothetical protein
VIDRRIAALCTLMLTAAACGAQPPTDTPRILARYASLPLRFEPLASAEGDAAFLARGASYAMIVSRNGARLVFDGPIEPPSPIDIRFIDADRAAVVAGVGDTATRVHRLRRGGRADVDVTAYERIAVTRLYPGIDVVFHGDGRELEYDVVVEPGGDPSRFAFRIDGSERVTRSDRGDLLIATPSGALMLRHPVAYQDSPEGRRYIASTFDIADDGAVRIDVGDYDRAQVLTIDPVVSYATYLGGRGSQQGMALAVDGAGNVYVAGYTTSTEFPLVNAFDRSIGRKNDTEVFVSKLNAAGTALVWSTYLGGSSGTDRAVGIAVDAGGSVYVTGQTSGSDFPTTATAWQKAISGGGGFVAKLAPAGNALVYSTYVGAATPSAIAVDGAGNAYVAGSATSSFAATAGALRRVSGNPNGSTGFVLKLNASGSAPVFATFLGGTGGDDATAIAVDAKGDAYVGGWTTSNDFPVRNAFQSARVAQKDAFVSKLASDGTQFVYSTLLGGTLDDAVNAIAIDKAGNAYVAGETYSADFPVKNGFQMRKAGQRLVNSSVGNAFVAKLAPTGNGLVYASFLGGEVCLSACQTLGSVAQYPADAAYGIAVDDAGHAYVAGMARSYTFPLIDSSAPRKQQDNQDSAFAAKVAISGGNLMWSTFLRTGYDELDLGLTRIPAGAATAVAVDASGNAYVTGDSNGASNFEPTPNAFQTVNASGPAAIIVKFAATSPMTLATSDPAADATTPITLTATLLGASVSGTVTFMDGSTTIASAAMTANNASVTLTLPAGIHTLSALLRSSGTASDTPVVSQVVDVPLVCN